MSVIQYPAAAELPANATDATPQQLVALREYRQSRRRRRVLTGLVALMVVLAVAAPLLIAAAPALAYQYPSLVKTAFITHCESKGDSAKGCRCVLSYIEAHEPIGPFETQGLRYIAGGPVPVMISRGFTHCGLRVP